MACRSSCPYLGEIGLCRFNKHMLPMYSLRQRLEPVQGSGSMRNGAAQYIHSLMTKLWKRMSHALPWRIVNKISDCRVSVLVFIFGVHLTVPTMLTALRNFFEWSVYFFFYSQAFCQFSGAFDLARQASLVRVRWPLADAFELGVAALSERSILC